MNLKALFSWVILIGATVQFSVAQEHSVARQWNEALLDAIRTDFARPTVHARNLFHTSVALYDSWAIYDEYATTFLLGKTVGGFSCPLDLEGIEPPIDPKAAQEEAMSYAAYRLLRHRFLTSPNAFITLMNFDNLMADLGYDINVTSTDYTTGSPAAMGNYLGQYLIDFGLQDGSNEQMGYGNLSYMPVNPPLVTEYAGNPDMIDPNRWQPLTLDVFIDQSGNEIPFNTPPFLSPEWGIVTPFSLTEEDRTIYERDGFEYWVFHDPGAPPLLDTMEVGGLSEEYKWGFELVSIWSSHLDPADGVMIDISPGSIGNIQDYPTSVTEYADFYDLVEGGETSPGHAINPHTGEPYEPQIVPRADYARVLAEFWADGPDSETPPGHWFTILNYVNDHPEFEKRYRGEGPVLDDLEWDVKAYFSLAGAMHDVAISAWGIKGWYDYTRPISAIRYMADKGQSSDPNLPSYHPAGVRLLDGYIELVEEGDELAGDSSQHVGKIKLYAWRGPEYIEDPDTDLAGVGWILAENWWPYQRPSFVTPPFAGYISGHSTYSRAAAELMTLLTGDPFFPGGMGEFHAPQNEFLVFEEGPSVDITLQWATYRDASDQTSLSRIWGGIHPPADDIPGRFIGMEIGVEAFNFAETYFFQDNDMDGYYHYEDCNDEVAEINPGAVEICDNLDNDCNGFVDDDLDTFTYYVDNDGDGYGDESITLDTCLQTAPEGYADNAMDCDDGAEALNPDAVEVCDNIDNDCNGFVDDDLDTFTYYIDSDGDGYGDEAATLDTCLQTAPEGYVDNAMDCDDGAEALNPDAVEICDGIDNNCDGAVDEGLEVITYYMDSDGDGYGDEMVTLDTCLTTEPDGFVTNNLDCDDDNMEVNPDAMEVVDDIDNDCNGMIDDVVAVNNPAALPYKVFPNPTRELLYIQLEYTSQLNVQILNLDGKQLLARSLNFIDQSAISLGNLPGGVYVLTVTDEQGRRIIMEKVVKM